MGFYDDKEVLFINIAFNYNQITFPFYDNVIRFQKILYLCIRIKELINFINNVNET